MWAEVVVAAGREDHWVSVEKDDVLVLALFNDLVKNSVVWKVSGDYFSFHRFGFPRHCWSLIGIQKNKNGNSHSEMWVKLNVIFCCCIWIVKGKGMKPWRRLRCSGLIPLPSPRRFETGIWFSRNSGLCQSRKNIFENYPTFLFQNWTWFSAEVVWSRLLASAYQPFTSEHEAHNQKAPNWTKTTFHPGALADKNGWVWSFMTPYEQQKSWSLNVLS